jgi:Uma2 family endonuclease
MSASTSSVLPPVERFRAVPTDYIWRLSVDQYHAMVGAGILTDDDPVELLEGWLVPQMPKNPSHRIVTLLIRRALERMIPAGWYVDSQEPITTADSEPEPDVVIVRGETQHYPDRHPGPQDVAVVVEVADWTLGRDQGWKKRLYAAAGIPVYWIANLVDNRIEVYSEPSGPVEGPDYHQRQDYGLSDAVPLLIDGVEVGRIPVGDILPQ